LLCSWLHATVNNNTRREEQLKLTNDDYIAFYKNEFEMGYLDRERWEKALQSSVINTEDDDQFRKHDDQFRDALPGGFMSDTALFHNSKTN